MEKNKKRLADIFSAFDKESVLDNLKLRGVSALQFLIKESNYYTNKLTFDFDSPLETKEVSEIRKEISKQLPSILLKQSFSINTKMTNFGSSFDHYFINDLKSKEVFEIYIDYLNRYHILKPEFYARKDEVFKDIHINSLSMAENYAIYIVDYLFNKASKDCLETIFNENKILIQQLPFIRKMVAFYIGFQDEILVNSKLLFNKFLKEVVNFSEKEIKYIEELRQGNYNPEVLLPPTMAVNVSKHPKAILLAKKYRTE